MSLKDQIERLRKMAQAIAMPTIPGTAPGVGVGSSNPGIQPGLVMPNISSGAIANANAQPVAPKAPMQPPLEPPQTLNGAATAPGMVATASDLTSNKEINMSIKDKLASLRKMAQIMDPYGMMSQGPIGGMPPMPSTSPNIMGGMSTLDMMGMQPPLQPISPDIMGGMSPMGPQPMPMDMSQTMTQPMVPDMGMQPPMAPIPPDMMSGTPPMGPMDMGMAPLSLTAIPQPVPIGSAVDQINQMAQMQQPPQTPTDYLAQILQQR